MYKWAVVMNCKCGCHEDDGMSGHDSLCCSIPNGLKKNNPFKEELDLEDLTKKMHQFEIEADEEIRDFNHKDVTQQDGNNA